MGFPREEYWSGFSFPSPEDLPDPGVKPTSPPALQMDSLPPSHQENSPFKLTQCHMSRISQFKKTETHTHIQKKKQLSNEAPGWGVRSGSWWNLEPSMKGGVSDDHHVACTSKKGVFRTKEAEWSGRSHESIENSAVASLPSLDLGEFSLRSRAAEVASSWESHSQEKEGVAGESSEDAEAVGDFLHKKTRVSGNTGGRFGGDGSGGNGPEAVKEGLAFGVGPEDNWEVRQLKPSGMLALEWAALCSSLSWQEPFVSELQATFLGESGSHVSLMRAFSRTL